MIVNTYPIQARDGAGSLTVYLLDDQHLASPAPRPMVVVVPGGAYGGLAPTESEPGSGADAGARLQCVRVPVRRKARRVPDGAAGASARRRVFARQRRAV